MALNTATNPATLEAGVQLYSAKFIEELSARLIPVTGFSRNFTDDFTLPGVKLEVPFLVASTAGDYNAQTNNFATPTTDTLKSCTVALGEHPIIKFTVTPEMVAQFQPIHWEKKAQMNAIELAAAILSKIAAVPVSNKVTQSTQLPKDITIPSVIELAKVADGYNINPRLANLYLTPTDSAPSCASRPLPPSPSLPVPTWLCLPPSPTSALRRAPAATPSWRTS